MKRPNPRTTLIAVGAIVLLLLGSIAPMYAQQGQDKQNNKQQRQQPPQKQNYRLPPQRQPVQRKDMPGMWQQHRAQNWQTDHQSWQQRGGYNGYRIPQSKFRVNFGRNHRFRLSRRSMALVDGRPHFQYGGYWFGVMDPWPGDWSGDWYNNDDVYVDYSNDGYYLYNRKHPGVGLSLNVYLN